LKVHLRFAGTAIGRRRKRFLRFSKLPSVRIRRSWARRTWRASCSLRVGWNHVPGAA